MNTIRLLMGHNTNNASVNSRNDAFALLTPAGAVFAVANNAVNTNGQTPGYDLVHHKTLSPDVMDGFLARYGFVTD